MKGPSASVAGTAQATETADDAKAAARARSLANLRPAWKPGQSGNPNPANNGRGKANEIAAFLDQPESIESNRSRFEAVVDRLYQSAQRGDTLAAKVLIEYKLGKPRTTPNALDIAEHIRRVGRDRIDIALGILGARMHTMEGEKLKEFFQTCERDTSEFFVSAERLVSGETPQETAHDGANADGEPQAAQAEGSPPVGLPGADEEGDL